MRVALATALLAAVAQPSAAAKPNLLFIVVDDLRTELGGVFNVSGLITPGIDKLMSEGVTFTRAYANVPVCSPSRTSFLTGIRPRNTRIWTIGPYFREQAQNASAIVTLPQALKTAGFNTTGAGKIWHPGTSSGGALSPSVGGDDSPWSWSYPNATAFYPYWECDQFYNGTLQSTASVYWPGGTGCIDTDDCAQCFRDAGINSTFNRAWINPDCPDNCFPDGAVADRGLQELAWKAAHPSDPWALFLGFKRPHLNFFAPSWAYDMYDNATTPLAASRLPAQGMPQAAFYENGEIAGAQDVHPTMFTYTDEYGQQFKLVADWKQRELKWAYRSSLTFMDSQVLRVLNGLEALGLRNNTWITFVGDHGWSLGEHGEWAKQNNFEEGTRVPMIIVPPTGPAGNGFARNATFGGIVELLDLFPTVIDLMGLPDGIVPTGQLEGDNLASVLRTAGTTAGHTLASDPNFTTAFSEISRGTNASPTTAPPDGSIQGLSVRTPDWRFAAWVPFNYTASRPLWSQWNATWDVELYDHRGDSPGGHEDYDLMENVNLARDPTYASVVQQLTAVVQARWP